MRPGEIVRGSNGLIGTWCARGEFKASCIHHKHREGMAYTSFLESDVDILTVAELFAAAGHPVPEGARLFAHFLVRDGMTASDVRRYWGWRLITEVGHFLNGAWQVDKIDEANASDPIRVISAVSIDLSRLPALDAWAAIPDEIKAVVA